MREAGCFGMIVGRSNIWRTPDPKILSAARSKGQAEGTDVRAGLRRLGSPIPPESWRCSYKVLSRVVRPPSKRLTGRGGAQQGHVMGWASREDPENLHVHGGQGRGVISDSVHTTGVGLGDIGCRGCQERNAWLMISRNPARWRLLPQRCFKNHTHQVASLNAVSALCFGL